MTRHTTDSPYKTNVLIGGVSKKDIDRLVSGDHTDPHGILGAHPCSMDGKRGTVVRAQHPDATAVDCVVPDRGVVRLYQVAAADLFAGFIPDLEPPVPYRLRVHFPDGNVWETEDPYRFVPTIGDMDIHLYGEGTHRRLWQCMGAHTRHVDGVEGTAFSVWAPNARRVSVVGDFCQWDGRRLPMRQLGASGVFELFVPGVRAGALYKYEIKTKEGALRIKSDPFAVAMELPPGSAGRVYDSSYQWGDGEWMQSRRGRNWHDEPMAIYELHLGSWARFPEHGNRPLTYREIGPRLVEHVQRLGFTHIELLPIAEHPFSGSWGYQVTGYYAPTARFGSPDDLRYLIDVCHQNGIGVILDWVPAHFPKDDFALRRFDGTALYEHEDPRRGEHPDWGTLIFNYGRNEVRNFLLANAAYWLDEFHVDGLRVDAVASMLYLDYSREQGGWIPNRYGGRENLEALDFLRQTNEVIREDHPGCITIAEESTAWPGVTKPVSEGGLGFSFKWNMGWMHDTLTYMSKEPVHRQHHQDQLTFAMLYEYSERFIMPISHDEVVHGKRSLFEKMPGDSWQKFANLRLLLTYQYTRPGKQLLFMGTELAPYREWDHDTSLDWHLAEDPERGQLATFFEELGRLYRELPCLWRRDHDPIGFSWIDCSDRENSVMAYARHDGEDHVIVALNMTPVPRTDYRLGAPAAGRYVERLSSDDPRYGGSDVQTRGQLDTQPIAYHGRPQSLSVTLPPLGALILQPAR